MKKWILTVLALILIALGTAGYFIYKERNTQKAVISLDPTWLLVLPEAEIKDLKSLFSRYSIKLVTDTPDSYAITDGPALQSMADSYAKYSYVIFSPAETKAITLQQLNASEIIPGITIGVGTDNNLGLFDIVLISDTAEAWNSIGETDAQIMKDKQPTADLFSSENTQKYIVDYRFSKVVPSANLDGVISPDLVSILETLLNQMPDKGTKATETLNYEYRKALQ